jgi:hypothetical protein
MHVIIDGVTYAPVPDPVTDKTVAAALELRFDSDAGDNLTIRDYLRTLLETLWRKGEGFSSKRPFGNSSWEHDIYRPLIAAGFLVGELNEDGYVEDFDQEAAERYGFKLIVAAFHGMQAV